MFLAVSSAVETDELSFVALSRDSLAIVNNVESVAEEDEPLIGVLGTKAISIPIQVFVSRFLRASTSFFNRFFMAFSC